MPELPEVETLVREIRGRVSGHRIDAAIVARPDFIKSGTEDLPARLKRRTVTGVRREGKRILLDVDDGAVLMIHLGMSGRVTFEPAEAEPLVHTHVRIRLEGAADEMRLRDPRRFGGVWYCEPMDKGKVARKSQKVSKHGHAAGASSSLSPLGPDALTLKLRDFRRMCERRRQIKALLLDQRIVSGMGNIYCDEALFTARIHPAATAASLDSDRVRRLCDAVRATLNKAIAHGGSTLRDYVRSDGREGEFQKIHRVYGREDEPCVRCGVMIVRALIAGRSTHFCPRCQPVN
mgnify:CR=1 FL=1